MLGKLQHKIMLAIVACSVVVVFIIGLITIIRGAAVVKTEAKNKLLYMAKSEAYTFNTYNREVEKAVQDLAATAASMADISRIKSDPAYLKDYNDRLGPIVKQLASETKQTMNAYIVLAPELGNELYQNIYTMIDGEFTLNNFLVKEQFKPEDPAMEWYYGPVQSRKGVWTDPYLDSNLKIYMVTYAAPIYARDGTLLGVAGMDIDFTSFRNQIAGIKLYKTGFAYLLSPDYNFLVHKTFSEKDNLLKVEHGSFKDVYEQIVRNSSGVMEHTYNGQKDLIAYFRLANGQTFLISVPEKEVMSL